MVLLTPWGWHYNLLFLCFVVIIAAALRLGFLGAALLVAALDAAILLVVGVTPAESIMRADMRRLYVLQLLLATVAGSGFILASTIDDYRRMRTVLATHRDRLSELVAERTRRLADEVKERRRAERALADSHRLLELQLDDRERALLAAKREAEEANRAKSRFLQNVSHELRTPLNAILGFGGMILNGIHGPVRPAVYGEYVRHIVEAGEHLRDLVNRLLDVERSDDVSAFSCTAVDPREIVANSIRLMAPHAAGRRVELEMVCADDLPMVWGDAARLRQIVINLLDNAIKYGPAGGRVRVVLHRSCETRQGGNDADQDSGSAQAWVDLRVEDEGPGVPERLRERIFERFGRAHDADIADAPAGLGLGLYLVRRMVEAMGGAVWVEDAPSGGACFIVRLKIASA